MVKSIFPNFKEWTIDERRLFVVFLLTLIYPMFVSSFFALYVFVLLPVLVSPDVSYAFANIQGWYHMYWLVASMLWLILCIVIAPTFEKVTVQNIHLGNIESSPLLPPAVKVEIKNKEDSCSISSQSSKNSKDYIKKATCDLEPEEHSLITSRQSLQKSITSLERKRLTESNEFLEDCMSTIQSEDLKKDETVCEIHDEENKVCNDEMKDDPNQEEKDELKKDSQLGEKDVKAEDYSDKSKEDISKHSDDDSFKSSSEDAEVEPFLPALKAKSAQTSSPLTIKEAMVEQQEDASESEMIEEADQFESNTSVVTREKARPTIDTSRASGYYECSMPTPRAALERQNSQSNTVFLFINPDTANTEDSILVSHGGEVKEDTEVKNTDI